MVVLQMKIVDYYQRPSSMCDVIEDSAKLRHLEELLFKWLATRLNSVDYCDRLQIRNFLRNNKLNMETTKKRLEKYYRFKSLYPSIMKERLPSSVDLRQQSRQINFIPLPNLTKDGDRLIYISLANSDVQDFNMASVAKYAFMIYDLSMLMDYNIQSDILIFDSRHFLAPLLARFISQSFKDLVKIAREAYAARIKEIHVINVTPIVETLLVAIKPLLHEKIRKRFHIHDDVNNLSKRFNMNCLPTNLGGNGDSLEKCKIKMEKIMDCYENWFIEQDSIELRTEQSKLKRIDMEGSFRKLEID